MLSAVARRNSKLRRKGGGKSLFSRDTFKISTEIEVSLESALG